MTRVLRVIHEIAFSFDAERHDLSATVRLTPLDSDRQRVLHHQEMVWPHNGLALLGEDRFGNPVSEMFWESVTELTIQAMSAVELRGSGDRLGHLRPESFFAPTLLTPQSPRFEAMAHRIFGKRRIDASSLFHFAKAMRATLRYEDQWVGAHRTAVAALRDGEGAHDDYAHVAVAVLRSLGHAACVVRGYLLPASGSGTAQDHAWVAVYTDGHGWLEVDPMLGCPPDLRHVAVAVGRDRCDTEPVESRRIHQGLFRVSRRLSFYPLTRTDIPPEALFQPMAC